MSGPKGEVRGILFSRAECQVSRRRSRDEVSKYSSNDCIIYVHIQTK